MRSLKQFTPAGSFSRAIAWGGLTAGMIASSTASMAADIKWRSGPAALSAATPQDVRGVLSASASRGEKRHIVVQFDQPVTPELRNELAASGIELGAYLGEQGYFAAVSPRADLDTAAGVTTITGASEIRPEWKMHPILASGKTPEWAQVGLTDGGDPIIGLYVLFHPDVDLIAEGKAAAEQYGALVQDYLYLVNGLVIEMPISIARQFAAHDSVQYIEQALPQLSENNASNRARIQADQLQAAPYNLTGAGVTVLVYDGGTARATHQDFNGRLTVHDASGQISHATHVSGTIGGSGTANATHKGMAPGVTILSYGLQSSGGIFLYTNPGDLQADYTAAFGQGADISNNSIGTNTESNGFDCNIQGDYGVTDALIDNIVRGSMGAPFRVVWANGNERQGNRCDIEGVGDYRSTAPPATAKNHITVGALNSNDDSMTTFSSWGPTDDGRLKPDISAPGCQSGGDNGVTSCTNTSDTAYAVLCGTSMASPTVCGISALILQDYRVQFPGADPRNSTLKIFLAHTAADLGNAGPDYQFGYGSVRAQAAVDFMRLGRFFEDSVSQAGTYVITTAVGAGDPQLKVTMAWDDAAGTPNVNPAIINDLDLRVFDPNNVQRFPWTLSLTTPSANAVQTVRNSVDNIEQVLVNSPMAGTWRIEVHGFNVPQGPQPFSLCCSHALNFPPSLQISLNSTLPTVLAPGATANVSVRIRAINDTVVANSPTMHVRYDAGPFIDIPLTFAGGEIWQATLPPPVCTAMPQYYFSADGTVSGEALNPPSAPATNYSFIVGTTTISLSDQMETDPGWTIGAPGDTATTGIWNRMDPQATTAQPEDDHTTNPGVNCWVTNGLNGGSDGANDVDGGATSLTSPTFDLSAAPDAVVSYWRWYSNSAGGAPNADIFRVQISSNNGASFSAVETVGPTGAGTSGGWIQHSFSVFDLDPPVTPTATMKLRFIAEDAATGSLIEAAVDDLQVSSFGCNASLDDCNENGIVDSDDIASGRSADVNSNNVPDECENPVVLGDMNCDGQVNILDINAFTLAISDPAAYALQYPGCNIDNGDINGDGNVDILDINGFVSLLSGG
ncbi:Serine protease AprX [Phycisphaerae bacterium RAS1]|nr:Serine protease AprX [Phycisphaerae bacterium RAS1]